MADIPLYNYAIQVIKVTDGDSLDVLVDYGFHEYGKKAVRLYDIDTPEIRGINADKVRGPKATQFTDAWLRGDDEFAEYLDGLMMDSRKYDPKGKYGRALADIYRPGDPVSLNDALVAAGHEK